MHVATHSGKLFGLLPRRIGLVVAVVAFLSLSSGAQAPPAPIVSTVVNGASFRPGPVAAGEIVSIFGTNMGPTTGVGASLTPSGLVDTFVANTRVLFDGVPAPLIYVRADQINAIVPYAVAGKSTSALQIEAGGLRSNVLNVSVAASTPGIFTANATGIGAGAIFNEDGTLNSSSNPALKGSTIVLYATGEGQTDPPGTDGKLAEDPLPRPLLPVSVTIGLRPAEVLYAGAAPGFAGLLQVNARIPREFSAASTTTSIRLTVGATSAQVGVTVGANPLLPGVFVFPGAVSAEILYPPNGSTVRMAPGETFAGVPIVGRVLAEFDFQATVVETIQAAAGLAILSVRTIGTCTFGSTASAGTTYEIGLLTSRPLTSLTVPDSNSRNGIIPDPCQPSRMLRVTIDPAGKPFLDMTPLPNTLSPSTGGTGQLLYAGNELTGLSGRESFLPEPRADVITSDGRPMARPPFGRVDLVPPGNYTVRMSVSIGGISLGSVSSSFSVVP